jgi:uncharacterized membrane protein YoaT (DUF817 family)
MNFATIISFILIGLFVYFQRNSLWFNFLWRGEQVGYDPNLVEDVRSVFILVALVGFIIRNEVDSLRSKHHDH